MANIWRTKLIKIQTNFSILVKTDQKDRDGRSVLKECDCAMMECLYDYVGR